MIFTSDQVAMTILVALLGLIAMIVALRIRRHEQPQPLAARDDHFAPRAEDLAVDPPDAVRYL